MLPPRNGGGTAPATWIYRFRLQSPLPSRPEATPATARQESIKRRCRQITRMHADAPEARSQRGQVGFACICVISVHLRLNFLKRAPGSVPVRPYP
jgi:hypothetical protein